MNGHENIGIIGDGQLGRMLVEDGLRYNPDLTFRALGEGGSDSPAAQVGAKQIDGSPNDPAAIRALVEVSDVTTWEFEGFNASVLVELEAEGHNIQPSPRSLLTIQDKPTQKRHLEDRGIAVAPYTLVASAKELAAAREALGDELMIKARRGGFDGRGNYKLSVQEDWEEIEAFFDGKTDGTLYAEQLIPFKRELSLVGARDMLGNIVTYQVVQTVHQNSICHTVYAGTAEPMPTAAEEVGRATIAAFEGAGIFAVEMFETEDGEISVNEVASRVHNSAHWTDLGAFTSQFEQDIRAKTGAPLGSTAPTSPASIMKNVLRTKDGVFKDFMRGTDALNSGMAHVRWYGKAPRPGEDRKIGHITARGTTPAAALDLADLLKNKIA